MILLGELKIAKWPRSRLNFNSLTPRKKSLAAGYGIQMWPIVQDINQLKGIYNDKWETFLANAGVTQFFTEGDTHHLARNRRRFRNVWFRVSEFLGTKGYNLSAQQ